jgi:hypothetical protein
VNVPKKERASIAAEMTTNVLKEVQDRYAQANLPCPHSAAVLQAKVPALVKNLVMKVEYVNENPVAEADE